MADVFLYKVSKGNTDGFVSWIACEGYEPPPQLLNERLKTIIFAAQSGSIVPPAGSTIEQIGTVDSDCNGTITPTSTTTSTSTSTTSTTTIVSPQTFSLGYNVSSKYAACDNYVLSPTTYYARPGTNFNHTAQLFTNSSLTTYVPNGYYSNGIDYGYVNYNGVLTDLGNCAALITSTTTSTTSTSTTSTSTSTTSTTTAALQCSYNGGSAVITYATTTTTSTSTSTSTTTAAPTSTSTTTAAPTTSTSTTSTSTTSTSTTSTSTSTTTTTTSAPTYNSFLLAYSSTSGAEACSRYPMTFTNTYYTDPAFSVLSNGVTIYQNSNLTNPAGNGYYSNGTNYWNTGAGAGMLANQTSCGGTTTSTTTSTTTTTAPTCFYAVVTSTDPTYGASIYATLCDGTSYTDNGMFGTQTLCVQSISVSGGDYTNGGGCSVETTTTTSTTTAPSDTFYVSNVDGTGTITGVDSGGIEFAVITTGNYPLSAGQNLSGTAGSLTGASVTVGIFNPTASGCIVIEINNIPYDSLAVSGGGNYTFPSVTFTNTDIVHISYYSGACL